MSEPAATTNDAAPPAAQHPRGPLLTFAYGMFAAAALGLLLRVLNARILIKLYSPGGDEFYEADERDKLFESLTTNAHVMLPLIVAAWVAATVGLYRLVASTSASAKRAGWVLPAAAALLSITVAHLAMSTVASYAKLGWWYDIEGKTWFLYASVTIESLALILSALAFHLISGRRLGLFVGVTVTATLASVGMLIARHYVPIGFGWSGVFATLPYYGALVAAGFAALAAGRGASDVTPSVQTAHHPSALDSTWERVGAGLRLYTSALSWRLVLTVAGYMFLLFAALSRSPGFAKFMIVALSLMALITGGFMVAGVVRFSRQPPSSPAQAAAVISAVFMGIVLLLDLSGFGLLVDMLSVRAGDYGAALDARDRYESAQKLLIWGMALGFAGFIALIASLRLVSIMFHEAALAISCVRVGVLVVLTGASAFMIRQWLHSARAQQGEMLLAAFAVLGLVLTAIVAYLSLLRRVNTVIESRARAAIAQEQHRAGVGVTSG